MPHCILEHSGNLPDHPDWQKLLHDLHSMLEETNLFKLDDIKSRVVSHQVFRIGDGNPDRIFVTLNIQILEGRDSRIKSLLTGSALEILKRHFPKSMREKKFNLTVQVSEIHKTSYERFTNY